MRFISIVGLLLLGFSLISGQNETTYNEVGIRPTLMAFFNALDGPGWDRNDNWDSKASHCNWYGIKCDNNDTQNVIELNLPRNSLNGQMKFSIGLIGTLKRLDLSGNSILGKIPPTLSRLSNLTYLNLSNNIMDGEIPDAFGSFRSLEYLDLSGNLFEGSVPDSLGHLEKVKHFDLSRNKIGGLIPRTLGDLETVEVMNLSRNALTGWIPNSFDLNTTSLHTLDLSHNALNGAVNYTIAEVPNLKHLDISNNDIKVFYKFSEHDFGKLQYCNFDDNEWLCPLDNEEMESLCHAKCHRHATTVPGIAVFSIFCLLGAFVASIVFVVLKEKERIRIESGIEEEDDF